MTDEGIAAGSARLSEVLRSVEEAWDTVRMLRSTPGMCPTADQYLWEAASELNAAIANLQRAAADFAMHGVGNIRDSRREG